MSFSKKIFNQMKTEDPNSPFTGLTNSGRLISFAFMIDNLRNTIDHLVAGTTPKCDFDDRICDQKMIFDLCVYEWRCPVCDKL